MWCTIFRAPVGCCGISVAITGTDSRSKNKQNSRAIKCDFGDMIRHNDREIDVVAANDASNCPVTVREHSDVICPLLAESSR